MVPGPMRTKRKEHCVLKVHRKGDKGICGWWAGVRVGRGEGLVNKGDFFLRRSAFDPAGWLEVVPSSPLITPHPGAEVHLFPLNKRLAGGEEAGLQQ